MRLTGLRWVVPTVKIWKSLQRVQARMTTSAVTTKSLGVDFSSPKCLAALSETSSRRNGLLRAVGIARNDGEHHNRTLIDTTAGSGRDAALLAWHGWTVTMVEREESTHTALRWALTATTVLSRLSTRLRLHPEASDARTVLPLLSRPAVVYLDPMFPPNSHKPQQQKRQQQEPGGAGYTVRAGLQQMSAPPPNLEEQRQTLVAALSCATCRVVVKRPLHAPPLGDIQPCRISQSNVSQSRRRVRYDIYLTNDRRC